MADISSLTIGVRIVLLTERIAIVEFTGPRPGDVMLLGLLADDEPLEPWQDVSGGWQGEDGG